MRLSLFIQFDDQFPCGFLGVSDLEESANLGDARQAQRGVLTGPEHQRFGWT